jgi:hypothetical protein
MLPKDIFKHHTHIGLDLDETLAESTIDMLHKLHRLGQLHSIQDFEQISSFEWETLPGCTWTQQQMHAFFRTHHLTGVVPL